MECCAAVLVASDNVIYISWNNVGADIGAEQCPICPIVAAGVVFLSRPKVMLSPSICGGIANISIWIRAADDKHLRIRLDHVT
jgi:hypothetical protein